jgi:hypothetical protein
LGVSIIAQATRYFIPVWIPGSWNWPMTARAAINNAGAYAPVKRRRGKI